MLQLVVDPPDGRWSYQKSLIDEDRQIVFAPLGTLARGTADAFRLTWGNRVIPVSASGCEYQDENGQRFLVVNSIAVNGAGIELVYGVKPYLFESDQEWSAAQDIAAECVVAFAELAHGFEATMASGDGMLGTFLPEGARRIQRGLE